MRMVKLVIGTVVVGLALSFMTAFAFAMPPVPYLTNPEERSYVGQGLYTEDGVEVGSQPDLVEEVVLYLVGNPEVRDENDHLVPRIIEIREWIPEVALHQMPIRRLMWDEDGDGYADYVAVADGYRDAKPQFRVFPIGHDVKRPMAKQGHFRITIKPLKES